MGNEHRPPRYRPTKAALASTDKRERCAKVRNALELTRLARQIVQAHIQQLNSHGQTLTELLGRLEDELVPLAWSHRIKTTTKKPGSSSDAHF
jgi:hypothetical protein